MNRNAEPEARTALSPPALPLHHPVRPAAVPGPPVAPDWPTWGQRILPAELDMGAVATELYTALEYIESLRLPGAESDRPNGNTNANPNTNFAPHAPIPSPNPA